MSDTGSTSATGQGFAMRMVVLVVLLGLVAGGFFYDQQLQSSAAEKIEGLMNTLLADKGGKRLSPGDVQKEFGFAPSSTTDVEGYQVQKYEFNRLLPFAQGQYMTVVYEKDQLHTAMANKGFDPNQKSDLMEGVKMTPESEREKPDAQVGGGDVGLSDESTGDEGDDKEGDDKEGDDKEGDDN